MVSVWAHPAVVSYDTDGTVTLSNGRVLTLDDIPGNGWNQNRLNKLNEAAQAVIDVRIPLADLPADDPDKTTDPARATLFWEDGDLVARPTLVSFTYENGELVPHFTEVRG